MLSQQPPRARPQHCPKVSTPCSNPPSACEAALVQQTPPAPGTKEGRHTCIITVFGFGAPWTPFLDVSKRPCKIPLIHVFVEQTTLTEEHLMRHGRTGDDLSNQLLGPLGATVRGDMIPISNARHPSG